MIEILSLVMLILIVLVLVLISIKQQRLEQASSKSLKILGFIAEASNLDLAKLNEEAELLEMGIGNSAQIDKARLYRKMSASEGVWEEDALTAEERQML